MEANAERLESLLMEAIDAFGDFSVFIDDEQGGDVVDLEGVAERVVGRGVVKDTGDLDVELLFESARRFCVVLGDAENVALDAV